jgi:trk system potassium uptake protein TrkA
MADAVTSPEELAAHSTANAVIRISGGGVRPIEEFSARLELREPEVAADAPAANERFSEVGFPKGSLTIQRVGERELASGKLVLGPGVQYPVATNPQASSGLIRLLRW